MVLGLVVAALVAVAVATVATVVMVAAKAKGALCMCSRSGRYTSESNHWPGAGFASARMYWGESGPVDQIGSKHRSDTETPGIRAVHSSAQVRCTDRLGNQSNADKPAERRAARVDA